MTRRFAEDTKVPVSRSRAEIKGLLCAWGADEIRWTDSLSARAVQLEFTWTHAQRTFRVRFGFVVRESAAGRTDGQHTKALDQRERALHRLLALHIKGLLNAVDAGLVSGVEALFPYIVGPDDVTYGQVAARAAMQLETSRPLLALADSERA